MGRRETPLDPDAGPVQRFAFELRALRRQAGGITYRAMAATAGYSVTTLSRAAAGEQLPSLAVTLAYVRACGGDPGEWEERWRLAEQQDAAGRAAEDDAGTAPYPGLSRFDVADRERFFGRGQLVAELVELVAAGRFTAVFGPSGSGKSSLLRAGLIPALRDGEGTGPPPSVIRVCTPGERPASTHAELLVPRDTDGDTCVIVDQFEEVFTLCQDAAERNRFVERLLAAREPGGRLRVVVAVRADFYGRCAEHPGLAAALREQNLLVGPMSPAELRDAIVKPAMAGGYTVERALTTRLVREVADEPGGLPLMSHVLLETWRRRRGRTLTEEAYERAGGLHGAIAKTAEDVYARFGPDQAALARALLLRLIAPGDGAQDTRRAVDRAELAAGPLGDPTVVLAHLVEARLLTVDEGTVNLAHEALITAWPRLRGWLEESRERLRVHRRLTEAARTWEELGRDPGALYRGSRLVTAEGTFPSAEQRAHLTDLERSFLTASTTAREEERRAAARTTRRLRTLLSVLSVLVVLALVAGTVAWRQNQTSERQRTEAAARRIAAVADSLRSSDPGRALRLSVAAWRLGHTPETRSALMGALTQPQQPAFRPPTGRDTQMFLTAGGRTLLTVSAREVAEWDTRTHRRIATHPGLGAQVDIGPLDVTRDGRTIALFTGPEGRIRLWDVRRGRYRAGAFGPPLAEADGGGSLQGLVRGGRFVVSGDDEQVQVWDVRRQRRVFTTGTRGGDLPLALVTGADGRHLAVCAADDKLELWDTRSGTRVSDAWPAQARCAGGELMEFSPDGRTLAVADANGVRRWQVPSGRALPALDQDAPDTLVFSDDGRFLATAGSGEILLWRLDRPEAPVFRHPLVNDFADALELDVAGRAIRYLGAGRATGQAVRTLDLGRAVDPSWRSQAISRALFSADGRVLATSWRDGRTQRFALREGDSGRVTRSLPPITFPRGVHHEGSLELMSLSADGGLLAHGTGAVFDPRFPDRVRITDVRTGRLVREVTPRQPDAGLTGALLSPDGSRLLTSGDPDGIVVVDVHRGTTRTVRHPGSGYEYQEEGELAALGADSRLLLTTSGTLLRLPSGAAVRTALGACECRFAFSPDGRYLAVAEPWGRVTLWDSTLQHLLGVLPGTGRGEREEVSALVFSHDGGTLAVGGAHGLVQLWDVPSRLRLGSVQPTPGDRVLALAFSPDGGTLYASGEHVPWQAYPIDPERAVATACRRAGGGLSRADWKTYLPEVPYRETC
ncbi:hypothetical protein AQ490_21645 [Wenjunlia vitaminophila]|uniref:HTH cro/C1-type domain-containing protein n=1 Tax=Wenjunlia vitaminophila TaxID=76728 RepID=A0A0T6LSM8_WENVI|nr:hypothetical protein [Wenjunlia vitaminophila]KRV49101.1 hypothetical protein AQ490_21645 [Wenjunlia vitaminophila]